MLPVGRKQQPATMMGALPATTLAPPPFPAARAPAASAAAPLPQQQRRSAWLQRGRRRLRAWASSPAARALARLLVVSYFLNTVYAAVEAWAHLRANPEALRALRRWATDPEPVAPAFPWLHVLLLLPAAIAEAAAPRVWAAAVLLGAVLWQDGGIAALNLKAMLLHGALPTELLAKPMAVCGAAALLLAAAVGDARRARLGAWVGPPTLGNDDDDGGGGGGVFGDDEDEEEEDVGADTQAAQGAGHLPRRRQRRRRRSALLLAGRLLMAALLLFLAWAQLRRMRARVGMPPPIAHHFGTRDRRDSAWALLQTAVVLPAALGVATRAAAALLAAALLAEAATVWDFWAPAPNFVHR